MIRGSRESSGERPYFGAVTYMLRNFNILKGLPLYPILSCSKKIGPSELNFTQRAATIQTGKLTRSMPRQIQMSSTRFATT